MNDRIRCLLLCCFWTLALPATAGWGDTGDATTSRTLEPIDVFHLEWASDPQVAPDGQRLVYVRNFMDIMTDRRRSNLWSVESSGKRHRPVTTGSANDSSPRWSPDGGRLLYVSNAEGSTQLWLRFMDTGQPTKLTNLTSSPNGIAWSPDGKWIAFSMFVRDSDEPAISIPGKPEGAEWAEPPTVIDRLTYRADGRGYLERGYTQLFVLPADGGTPRQITSGAFNHNGTPSWTSDGRALIFSANRHAEWEFEPANTEVYRADLRDGSIQALTERYGPDNGPVVSVDGKQIAYLGYDDRHQGYQVTRLYVMDIDGKNARAVSTDLDRSVQSPRWAADSKAVFVSYSDEGNTKVARISMDGAVKVIAADVGGTSIGRPYSSGSFSVSDGGRIVYTHTRPDRPADVAVVDASKKGPAGAAATTVTDLNSDLLYHKELADVEEIWFESSHDGRRIQGWIAKPPGFDPTQKYPLVLEIHGGPFANYGDRFSTEIQLFAAAGYVVFYSNPRGSTSYGAEFGNLIHHNYPGEDYDDLMSGVEAVRGRGYVDPDRLFVTGGSGGGVLTAWIVGKTDRFRAAVVAKPVINWYSFVLTSDAYNFFYKYWFPGFPWDHAEHYLARSPLSLVGHVSTPTMLLTGELDYRTPISESEQYYQALKLRKVPTTLVRIPEASHGIAARPSNLMAKVIYILDWFERYDKAD